MSWSSGKYCTEDSPLRPISFAASQKESEEFVLSRSESITFRLANVLGCLQECVDLLVNDFVHEL